MFRGIKNVSSKKIKNKITGYSILQLFFRGQKSNEQDESVVTEEFNVTNTFELHQELEKEPNLEYNYEEEEEEEEENEEQENDKEKNENNNNNQEIKNEKEDENNIMNEKGENPLKEDKKEEKKEDNKEEKKEDQKEEKKDDDLNNLGKEYMENDGNINTTNNKKEENQITENKKEPIMEEIDTTMPKDNPEENNNINQDSNNIKDDANIIVKGISPNTICHRIIPKGLDIDITKRVYFKCYKVKTKSNIISFITGSKKVKIPYLIFLDENFYYMLKDKPVNENNENIRRIGNRYDLSKISNFQTRKVDDDYEFAFEFIYEDYFDRIYKLLYFERKDAELFLDIFQQFSDNLGLDITGNIMDMEGEEEEEEDDEGEEKEEKGEKEEKEKKEENEGDENEEGENEEEEEDDNEEDEKEEKKENLDEKGNKENKENEDNIQNEKNNINKDDKKSDTETNSTKEESKEIRDVEIINQC